MLALGLDWALIAVCFASVIVLPNPLVFIVAFVLIGRTQLALAVLMHESAHRVLLPGRTWNDWVGQWLTAGPLLLSMFSYRRGHLQHHVAPMVAGDPVVRVFGIGDYPKSRSALASRLLRDLLGVGYLETLWGLLHARPDPQAARPPRRRAQLVGVLASVVVSQAVLASALASMGRVDLYLTLWLLPALTVLQLFARIRAITEHAGHGPNADQRLNARTVVKPSWQTFFVGPHNIHFHIEHHAHVRVPFYRLPDIHRAMREAGELPPENLYQGYGRVLREVSTLRLISQPLP